MNINSSNVVGRFKNMNLRFWGGWFLALAGIGILLTMGCEKGALGVKSALVTGRIVDSDSGNGIANATVRMISKEQVGMSEIKQGQNFASAVTGVNGNFIFENVIPDNVVFEYSAKNYVPGVYPSTEAPEEGQMAMVDFVSIKSGAVLNVGDLKMAPMTTSPLPETISVKLDLRNRTSQEPISDSILFDVYLNGQEFLGRNSSFLRDTGLTNVPSARTLRVVVRNSSTGSMLYNAFAQDYQVSGDVVEIIELEPVTYNIFLRAVNVPDYIQGGVINIFAERRGTGSHPPKVLARQTIDNLGGLSGPNLPVLIEVPGLQEPVDIRVQIRGYVDEVLRIDPTKTILPPGSQGNYRIDIDFLASNNATLVDFDPTPSNTANVAMMFDNMLTRDVILRVAGVDLLGGNTVRGIINLPSRSLTYVPPGGISPSTGSSVDIVFGDVAIGYNMHYTVTVSGSASGAFNIVSPTDGIMINPRVATNSGALAIGVHAKRPE